MKNISILNKPSINMVKGYHSNGIHCGLKKNNEFDLGLVYSETECKTFAVYTKNKIKGAPLIVCREHLKDNKAQALIVNSKIANTCTGEEGISRAKQVCLEVAKQFNIKMLNVIPMSTGVIGLHLPVDKIFKGITILKDLIDKNNLNNFTKAIMTTDTYPKLFGVSVRTDTGEYRIVGTAKGSGMIKPDMATMLSFIFTDANINGNLLKKAFNDSVDNSFNSITIDGDTSTNDTAIIFANGKTGNKEINRKNSFDYKTFCQALNMVSTSLAKEIVKDGEGATKFIEINVINAKSKRNAKKIAIAIADSKLVKTAFFGEDGNWGRILCAAGYSGADFNSNKINISIDNIVVFSRGTKQEYSEENMKKNLQKKEIKVTVDLNQGNKSVIVWTCDLSYDYIKINAGYRS